MKIKSCIAAVLVSAAGLSAATPNEIATSYFEAISQSEWETVPNYFHPEAMSTFRSMLSFIHELPPEAAPQIASLFGEGTDLENIADMSDKEFFTAIFKNMMEQVKTMGGFDFKSYDIIGTLEDGDNRHVVARTVANMAEMKMEKMEVLSFSPMDDSWGLNLQGEMKGMAEQMKMMFKMMKRMQEQQAQEQRSGTLEDRLNRVMPRPLAE